MDNEKIDWLTLICIIGGAILFIGAMSWIWLIFDLVG